MEKHQIYNITIELIQIEKSFSFNSLNGKYLTTHVDDEINVLL